MQKWLDENSKTKENPGLSVTLRLVADILDDLGGPGDIRLPGVLQLLKDDIVKLFEKFEKTLEEEPEGLDTEPSPDDNQLHGET